MAEQILKDKFVEYYYTNMAYYPQELQNIYGENSILSINDTLRGVEAVYEGKQSIAAGIQQSRLYRAIVNLTDGSISCICIGEKQYMLTVTGILRVEGEPRNFAQCFILEQLKESPSVFYIRAETLSLLSVKSSEESIDLVDEVAEETTEVLPVVEEPNPPREKTSEYRQPYHRSRERHRDNRDYREPRDTYDAREERESHGSHEVDPSTQNKPMKLAYEIVFVKNLPDDCTTEDLSNTFAEFGEINQIKLFSGKRYATVSFHRTSGDYSTHEIYDKIMASKKEFSFSGKTVRIEPFILNHRRNYDRYHTNGNRGYQRYEK